MKLYILNMKTDIVRKEFILDQLNILKIKNYEFVEAVNGKEHISDNNCDRDKFKSQYCRDILPGEWGCATSHIQIYDKIIESNEKIHYPPDFHNWCCNNYFIKWTPSYL